MIQHREANLKLKLGIKLDSGPLKYAYFYNKIKSIKNIHQLKHAESSRQRAELHPCSWIWSSNSRATNSWDPTNNDQQRLQGSQGLRSCTSSHKGKHFHSKRGCEVTSCVLFGPDFNEHASSSSLAAVCAVMWHICLHQTFAGVCIFWSIILLTHMTHTDVGYQMLQTCSVRLNTCAGVPRPSLCDSRVRGGAQC